MQRTLSLPCFKGQKKFRIFEKETTPGDVIVDERHAPQCSSLEPVKVFAFAPKSLFLGGVVYSAGKMDPPPRVDGARPNVRAILPTVLLGL